MDNEFSVCQFFVDGSWEYVKRFISADEAIRTFQHYTDNVATRIGVTTRVIITDGGDCIVAEWKSGEGLVYPSKGDINKSKGVINATEERKDARGDSAGQSEANAKPDKD